MGTQNEGLKEVPLPEIWKVQPREYLRGPYRVEIKETLPRLDGGYQGKPVSDFADRFDPNLIYAVPGHDNYMIARKMEVTSAAEREKLQAAGDYTYHHCLLLYRKEDGQVVVVGAVDDWGIIVDEEHRGKGLGAELAYASASFSGELNAGYALYSESGYGAFSKAHELAVGRALEAGLDVAPSIVGQYPRLSQAGGPKLG
jgi:GNAT superfamily N-acetyltransferase